VDVDAYFDRQGAAMSLMDWAKAFEDLQYRFIRTTEVNGGAVITVWSGLNAYDDDPPLIFGTIARTPDGKYCCEIESSTESEALAAHEALLERVARGWQHLT
jgi:hypothetical protein